MFKSPKAPMTAAEVEPTWNYLVRQKRNLQRNKVLCRILQPVGTVIFLFNLLLVTANLALFFWEGLQPQFEKVPILPALVEALPRGSLSGVLVFSVCFAYLPPLAICGLITGVFSILHQRRNPLPELHGTEAEQAKALAYQAEAVYALRKEIPFWSIFPEASILTGLTALPILLVCINLAKSDSPKVLEIALGCLALLVCLFGLFWIYVLLFKVFALLNALFYLSPGKWKLYMLYQRLDAYWESVDPAEFARRERRAQQEKKKRRRGTETEYQNT